MKNEILRMNHVYAKEMGSVDLVDFSMHLFEGEVLGVMGNCSSGKTLLLNIMAGKKEFTEGTLFLNEELVKGSRQSDGRIAALLDSNPKLIENLSITDNLFYVKRNSQRRFFLRQKLMNRLAQKHLDEFRLKHQAIEKIENLSIIEKSMIEIIKAYILGAKMILIDDFANRYTSDEYVQFYHLFEDMKRKGISFVLAGSQLQNLQICADRILVMTQGKKRIVFENQRRKQIDISRFLKQNANGIVIAKKQRDLQEIVFEGRNINTELLNSFSFQVYKGESLAIIDYEREAAESIYTLLQEPFKLQSNQFMLEGQAYSYRHVYRKVGFINFNIKNKIVPSMSLADNLCLSSYGRFSSAGFVRKTRMEFVEEEFLNWYPDYQGREQEDCMGLSEKDQIAILLFRLKLQKPKIVFCFEPRIIMDEAIGQKVAEIFRELTEMGNAIVIFSSNLESANTMAERFLILENGRVKEEYSFEDICLNDKN